jgi:DNA (cytosine-5)-methyltransferase 1
VDCTENQNIISFCTGYGGLEKGLGWVIPNLRTLCYVEIEAFAIANLVAKIEQGKMDAAPIWSNLKTFDGRPFRGKVHGILAGFPCQPFSVAGKRQGGYDPRHLWPHIAKHIRTIKPVFVCLENVPGLLQTGTLDNRPDLQRCIASLGQTAEGLNAKDRWYLENHQQRLAQYMLRTEGIQAFAAIYFGLRDMGYKVEAGLFTAAEVGAPHKRERLFILAYAQSERPLRESGSIQQADGRSRGTLLRQPVGAGNELENPERIGWRRRDNGGPGRQGRPLQIEGSGDVGNTDSQPGRLHTAGRDDKAETRSAGEKLANAEATERGRMSEKHAGRRTPESGGSGRSQLADTLCIDGRKIQTEKGIAIQRPEPIGDGDQWGIGQISVCRGQWPSRPGQGQYEWEEPRTVKSGMGRTVDGFASRVDELRLLGNGVVPAEAEKAFIELAAKAGLLGYFGISV